MKNIASITALIMIFLFAGFLFLNDRAQKQEQDQLIQSLDTIEATPQASIVPSSQAPNNAKITTMKIEDIKVGTGEVAVDGKKVTVHYTGTLTNGEKFDSSLDRGQPFTFTLGIGEVIAGWDQGVKNMKVGGRRKLTIPSELGYGANGIPPVIPPNAALIFDVELLKVE